MNIELRSKREKVYKNRMRELQIRWKNPIDDLEDSFDFDSVSDEELEKGIADLEGQIRFEKYAPWVKYAFIIIVVVLLYKLLKFLGI